MREMKDSGLKWLGKIPADWTLAKIGGLYSIRNEKVSDKDYPPLSVTNKGILPQLETAAKTKYEDLYKIKNLYALDTLGTMLGGNTNATENNYSRDI